jgi:pimeloyl-ACP methyl ester carboxylesterase
MQHTFTNRDGLRIAYDVSDFTDPWTKPDTLLLIHAAMGNSRRWYRWEPRLARHFRVVTFDLRGHGHSEIPPASMPFSLDQLVGDAVELLDRLKVDKAHIVGNSAGGYVGQKPAIHHPERVKTLAIYGAPPGLQQSQALTWIPIIQKVGIEKFVADTIHERFDENADPQLVQWFIRQTGSNNPEFIARFVTHMTTHWFMDEVHRIQCPTLIVAAGREAIGHADNYDVMKSRIAKAQLVKYDTAAHNICDGYADRCVDDLLRFLDVKEG